MFTKNRIKCMTENNQKSGIYKILNIKTNSFYIGSSFDIHKRWSQHKRALSNNKHCNKYLQAAYNKYGAGCFILEVVLYCDEANLLLEEQPLLDLYYGLDNCYNLSKDALSPMKGRKQSEETINKKHNKVLSEETKQKISRANKGKKKSKEARLNISKSKTGTLHPMFGKHQTEETKALISKHSTRNGEKLT